MNQLSLHHLTMLPAHPLELVTAAAEGGFEYCGLRFVAPMVTDSIVDVAGDPALIREIGARLNATGVRLLDIEAIWLQPVTDVNKLIPALEAGKQLGARGTLAVGYDTDEARLFDNFCRLCEAAAKLEMNVALEFITYCSIGTLGQAQSLIARSRQPNARLLIDALQFFRSGATPADLASVDPVLMPYMQLCDGLRASPVTVDERRREARTDRRLPGEGELPIAELLCALPAGIPISIEAPTLRLAGLPFNQQARIVGDTTRKFLATRDTVREAIS